MTTPYKNYNIHLSLITLITILSIIDFELTRVALEKNIAYEANPIMAYLISSTGSIWSILWAKMILLCGLIGLFFTTSHYHPAWLERRVTWMLTGINIVYVLLICHTTTLLITFYK